MTDPPEFNGIGLEQPVEVTAAVNAVRRARRAEVLLVIVASIGAVALVATTAWNTYRLRSLTAQNVRAQNFGLEAVNCILDNLADHRWSNQVFHDNLAEFFHAPQTPHVPLPIVPSDKQFADDCAPFNLRVEQREGTAGPTVTTGPTNTVYPTTTTMGVPGATTTSR